MPYCSNDDDKIYQENPILRKPSRFRPKSWTESILGYIAEARKLAYCIRRNRELLGRPYCWFVTVVCELVLSPKDIRTIWQKTCRKLRETYKLDALWVAEPKQSNKIHYHLLVKSVIDKDKLRSALRNAVPDLSKLTPRGHRKGWHTRIQKIRPEKDWMLSYYITKAKIRLRLSNGVTIKDRYARKRRLFKANLGLTKYGAIGKFWERPKAVLWEECRQRAQRIEEGMQVSYVDEAAVKAHEFIGGFIPLWELKRQFAYWSGSPAVLEWLTPR